ncbi:hypothetical protein V0R53_26860, partial [Pseudomonas sp. 120P]
TGGAFDRGFHGARVDVDVIFRRIEIDRASGFTGRDVDHSAVAQGHGHRRAGWVGQCGGVPDLTNSITGTTGGNYEKLETSGETTVTVTDGPGTQNETGLSLSATGSVDEGGQITYTATL